MNTKLSICGSYFQNLKIEPLEGGITDPVTQYIVLIFKNIAPHENL